MEKIEAKNQSESTINERVPKEGAFYEGNFFDGALTPVMAYPNREERAEMGVTVKLGKGSLVRGPAVYNPSLGKRGAI